MSNIPTNVNDLTDPTFIVGLLIPTIVLFSVMFLLVAICVPVTCCYLKVDRDVKNYLMWGLAVISLSLWVLPIVGLAGGYMDELLAVIDEIFETTNTVSANINTITTCFNNESDPVNLDPVLDIETDIKKYTADVDHYHDIAIYTLISCYSVLLLAIVWFVLSATFTIKPNRLTVILSAVILTIVFIIMIPVSNAGYSALSYVCGDNLDGHNKKVNELIASFDDTVTAETFCEHDTWKYLCDVQTCDEGDQLLGDVFNTTLLEELNESNEFTETQECEFEALMDLIENTLDDELGCKKLKGLYTTVIDTVLCKKVNQLFTFNLWPVGIASITTVMLFTIGLLDYDTDYVSVSTAVSAMALY